MDFHGHITIDPKSEIWVSDNDYLAIYIGKGARIYLVFTGMPAIHYLETYIQRVKEHFLKEDKC